MTVNHPDLGRITFVPPDRWETQAHVQSDEAVTVSIAGTGDGPNADLVPVVRALPQRYDEARPDIAMALLRLYREHVEGIGADQLSEDFPRVRDESEVWQAFTLVVVDVRSEKDLAFCYCFAQSDDDSTFSVRLTPSGVSVEYVGD